MKLIAVLDDQNFATRKIMPVLDENGVEYEAVDFNDFALNTEKYVNDIIMIPTIFLEIICNFLNSLTATLNETYNLNAIIVGEKSSGEQSVGVTKCRIQILDYIDITDEGSTINEKLQHHQNKIASNQFRHYS